MRRFAYLLALVIMCSVVSLGQIKNIKAIEGTWTGQWLNKYYSSSGSISAKFTINDTARTGRGEWTVGGNILGVARPPFTTDISFTASSFSASFNSPIWGDISGTGYFSGSYSGTSTNCPNPNAQAIAASGTFTSAAIDGIFSFTWYGTPITGTVTMTKQNPVTAPTSLQAASGLQNQINLSWSDNATNESGYRIDRKDTIAGIWAEIGTVGQNVKQYVDKVAKPATYVYRVAAYSTETESEYSNEATVKVVTAVRDNNTAPAGYAMLSNYPNPFNPSTTITYEVPNESHVVITIYTTLGEVVETVVNGAKPAGRFTAVFNAGGHSSGIYLVKMEAGGDFAATRKILLLK